MEQVLVRPPVTSLSALVRAMVPASVAVAAFTRGDAAGGALHPEEERLLSAGAAPLYRLDFGLGRAAARAALAQIGYDGVRILRGPHREPVWPADVVGAITHAGGHALAAVARRASCAGVGIDVAELGGGRARNLEGIADRVAFGDERDWIGGAAGEERRRRILALFSAKESVFKAFFPAIGTWFGFEAAALRWLPGAHAFAGRLLPPYDALPASGDFRIECRWSGDLVVTTLVLPT